MYLKYLHAYVYMIYILSYKTNHSEDKFSFKLHRQNTGAGRTESWWWYSSFDEFIPKVIKRQTIYQHYLIPEVLLQ